jgi:hypothetical protein
VLILGSGLKHLAKDDIDMIYLHPSYAAGMRKGLEITFCLESEGLVR